YLLNARLTHGKLCFHRTRNGRKSKPAWLRTFCRHLFKPHQRAQQIRLRSITCQATTYLMCKAQGTVWKGRYCIFTITLLWDTPAALLTIAITLTILQMQGTFRWLLPKLVWSYPQETVVMMVIPAVPTTSSCRIQWAVPTKFTSTWHTIPSRIISLLARSLTGANISGIPTTLVTAPQNMCISWS